MGPCLSIESTGNIPAGDRTATPQRATVMRVPPGGGPFQPFATGVRNGTGLTFAPDGALWTAVNNRDNVESPDEGPSYGQVLPDYVNEHPPESVAKLTPGRELGWPYCNPNGGPANLASSATSRPCRRLEDGLRRVATDRAEHGRALRPARHQLRRRRPPRALRPRRTVGVHGSRTVNPLAPPRSRSFPGRTAPSEISRPSCRFPGRRRVPLGPTGRGGGGSDGAVYVTDDAADAIYRVARRAVVGERPQAVEDRRHFLLGVTCELLEDELHHRAEELGRALHLEVGLIGDHRTRTGGVHRDGVDGRRE